MSADQIATCCTVLRIVCARIDNRVMVLVFEKHLAAWVPDHDVPVCPGCGKTFRRLMRKHHCRLCGCVICTECSRFLDEAVAGTLLKNGPYAAVVIDCFSERLTNPVGAPLKRNGDSYRRSSGSSSSSPMRRSNSNESLMSIMASMGSKDKEQVVRVCETCKGYLDRRLRQMEEKSERTELEELNEVSGKFRVSLAVVQHVEFFTC